VAGEPNYALGGEMLLVVSGVWPTSLIGPDEVQAAKKAVKNWQAEIRTLLEGAAQTKPHRPTQVKFLATWKRLQETDVDGRATAAIASPEIISTYKAARERAVEHLRGVFKPLHLEDLAGSRLIEPGPSRVQAASEVLATINDLGRVVYGLRAGSISPDAFVAVRLVFPAVYKMLDEMIGAELFRQRTRKATYRVPWHAEVVLRAFLGQPMGVIDVDSGEAAAEGEDVGAPDLPEVSFGKRRDLTKVDRLADPA
jgi:hypothetical protein